MTVGNIGERKKVFQFFPGKAHAEPIDTDGSKGKERYVMRIDDLTGFLEVPIPHVEGRTIHPPHISSA